MKVIYPPENYDSGKKIIFLAGPIQGSRDWQKDAIDIISKSKVDVDIANPRREYLNDEFVYEAQVDWETKFLNKAGENGVILFWLAKEEKHYCERPHAQTTRFELAEWKVKHQLLGRNIVLGIEEGFTNKRYITRRFTQDCPSIKICNTLEETCEEAISLIKNKN